MWFPPPSHNPSRQHVQVHRNVFQDSGIMGSSQVTELTQLLTPFAL
jgi:hypothetical protein